MWIGVPGSATGSDYVELVKSRAHEDNPQAQSAHHALASALSVLQRLLAPFLPFAAEECWSWWHLGSIHRAAWPDAVSLQVLAGKCANSELCIIVSDVLREVRRAKSEAKVSMKAGVSIVRVSDTATRLAALREVSDDLRNAGHIGELMTIASKSPCVEVTL